MAYASWPKSFGCIQSATKNDKLFKILHYFKDFVSGFHSVEFRSMADSEVIADSADAEELNAMEDSESRNQSMIGKAT